MTREPHRLAAALLASVALAAASGLQAQPAVQEFTLPPAAPTPSPTAAGPVDNDHPVAEPTRPTATPAATPSPVIVLPPVAPAAPREVASPRASQPEPRPSPSPAQLAPVATESAPLPQAVPTAVETAALPSTPPAIVAAPAQEGQTWLWLAGGAALAALAGALVLLRRRGNATGNVEWEPEPVPATEPQPGPPATLTPPKKLNASLPRPASKPLSLPPIEPPVAITTHPLDLTLEARHLSRAMVNASLAYRLTLTNRTGAPAGPLRIAGDIVSAQASLSATDQLDALAPIHQIEALAPGESATLSGELWLPLASIQPMQSGGARVFVPLARFRAEAADGTTTTRVFVIGQTSEQAGGALRPFPFDRGPGIDRAIGQRELEVRA